MFFCWYNNTKYILGLLSLDLYIRCWRQSAISLWWVGSAEKVKPNLLSAYHMPGTVQSTLLLLSHIIEAKSHLFFSTFNFHWYDPQVSLQYDLSFSFPAGLSYTGLHASSWILHAYSHVSSLNTFQLMLDIQQVCWMNTWIKEQAKLDYLQGEWEISKCINYPTHLCTFLPSLPTPVEQGIKKGNKIQLKLGKSNFSDNRSDSHFTSRFFFFNHI